jgi:hypothetical protein
MCAVPATGRMRSAGELRRPWAHAPEPADRPETDSGGVDRIVRRLDNEALLRP